MDLFTAVGRTRVSLLTARAEHAAPTSERGAAAIAETVCLRLQTLGSPDDAIAYLFAADQFALAAHLLAVAGDPDPQPTEIAVDGAGVRGAESALKILAGDLAASLMVASRQAVDPAMAEACRDAASAALTGRAAITRSERDAAHIR